MLVKKTAAQAAVFCYAIGMKKLNIAKLKATYNGE